MTEHLCDTDVWLALALSGDTATMAFHDVNFLDPHAVFVRLDTNDAATLAFMAAGDHFDEIAFTDLGGH